MKKTKTLTGTLYLIHFAKPVCDHRDAQHYLGFVKFGRTVDERFAEHCAGTGSKICRAAAQRGIKMEVVWTTPGTRTDERRLKNRNNHKAKCPKCRPKWLARRRRWDRTKRDRQPKPQCVAHVGTQHDEDIPL